MGELRTRFVAHVVAAVLLGVSFWVLSSWHVSRLRAKGRQTYLADQAAYFDTRVVNHRWRITSCAGAVVYIGASAGLYELVALGIYAGIKPKDGGRAA